jgi:4-hydroxythreonine-4-phosphate dehydrogenase
MAFCGPGNLRVALATIHEPLARVPALLTTERLEKTIRLVCKALHDDFGLARPRLGVLGLNPHAGEDGLLGSDEQRVLIPLLERLRGEGLNLQGPLVPDVAFRQRERFDLLLAMYHDQGLIPFKLLAFAQGVNITLGLPFVRTSVAHGTAGNIAGTGTADPSSFRAAWDLAAEIAVRRAAH